MTWESQDPISWDPVLIQCLKCNIFQISSKFELRNTFLNAIDYSRISYDKLSFYHSPDRTLITVTNERGKEASWHTVWETRTLNVCPSEELLSFQACTFSVAFWFSAWDPADCNDYGHKNGLNFQSFLHAYCLYHCKWFTWLAALNFGCWISDCDFQSIF